MSWSQLVMEPPIRVTKAKESIKLKGNPYSDPQKDEYTVKLISSTGEILSLNWKENIYYILLSKDIQVTHHHTREHQRCNYRHN